MLHAWITDGKRYTDGERLPCQPTARVEHVDSDCDDDGDDEEAQKYSFLEET
jgi:hypothetical protein